MMLFHVDDSCVIGNRIGIDGLTEKMRDGFETKVEGGFNDFLGCVILRQEELNHCHICSHIW